MTRAGEDDATRTVSEFLVGHMPLLYPPRIIDNPYSPDETRYFVTDQPGHRYFDLLLPRFWDTHRRDLLVHETGHVLAYWCGLFRDVIREWLAAMGGEAALNDHPLRGEMFAEHFVRAYVPEYNGSSYPQLVGMVPFNAASMIAFSENLIATTIPHMPSPINSVGASWSGPIPATNYRSGRRVPIDRLVFHHMVGFLAGTNAVFKTPGVGLSAHYGVPHMPGIVQWVSESDTAYHAAGDSFNPSTDPMINDRSLGIEVEDFGVDLFSDDQYSRCAQIARAANEVYGVPLDRAHVIRHGEVPGVLTACPGILSVDRILEEAQDDMFTDEDRRKLNRVYDHLEAYEPLVWTKRLQQWLGKAFKTGVPTADLTGPDVETNQPYHQP
jgi:hypothetical protein